MNRTPLLLSLALMGGCDVGIPELSGCPPVAVDYFTRHDWRDTHEFSSLDLDTQYIIFLCGQQRMGPARLELSEAMAMEGAPAALFLRQKLARATDDYTIRDIINVLTLMQRRGTFRVTDDAELLQLMHAKANSMRPLYRGTVVGWIAEVENAANHASDTTTQATSTATTAPQ